MRNCKDRYSFTITATNINGNTSDPSDEVLVTPVAPYEVGIVSTNGWTTVSTNCTYINPVVIAQPIDGFETSTELEYATAVVTNVTSSSFDVQLYSGDTTKNSIAGDVGYIVVEAGYHTLSNGVHMQAGIVTVDSYNAIDAGDTAYETITFPFSFDSTPSVVASANKDSAQDWVSARYEVGTLTNYGVNLSLEIKESYGYAPIDAAGNNVGDGTANILAWLAIDRGNATDMEAGFENDVDEDPESGDFLIIDFENTYTNPVFFGLLEENIGTDSTTVGRTNLNGTGVEVRPAEEVSNDVEQRHAADDIVWIVFDIVAALTP